MEATLPDGRVRPWEAEFIELWRADIPLEAIADAQQIQLGTVKSRAHLLQQEGKIIPRRPGRRRRARPEDAPAPATPAPRVSPAPTAPPAPHVAPAPPAPERKDIQQWTVRLSKALIEHIKRVAYERRVNPSELVERWLWEKAREKPGETVDRA
jgi:hypothetical protein